MIEGNEVNCAVTVKGEHKNAGEYKAVAELDASYSNYKLNENEAMCDFTIAKREVNVTIKDASKVYGQADPKFSYKVENGLENTELSDDFKKRLDAEAIVREAGKDVKEDGYRIYFASETEKNSGIVELENYKVTFTSGNFVIIQRDVNVTINNQKKEYGEEDSEFSFTADVKELNGENRVDLTNEFNNLFVKTLTRQPGEDVRKENYEIFSDLKIADDATQAGLKNYNIICNKNGVLEIYQREVTITAVHKEQVYGENDLELTYTSTNLDGTLPWDGSTTFKADFEKEYELVRKPGREVGTYEINLKKRAGVTTDNYNVTYEPNTVEITSLKVTITPDKNQGKVYGQADPKEYSYTVTLDGLKSKDSWLSEKDAEAEIGEILDREHVQENDETKEYREDPVREDGYAYKYKEGAVEETEEGIKLVENNNYILNLADGEKFKVAKSEIIVNWDRDSFPYDGYAQSPEASFKTTNDGKEIELGDYTIIVYKEDSTETEKENGFYKKIAILGHAMYDDYGKDIVCSATSSIVTTTINGILLIDKEALTYQVTKKGLTINVCKQDKITETLICNMISLLKELEENYKDNIEIK